MKPAYAITKWTIWQRRWSTFWWIVGIAAFIILVLVFYPALQHQAAQLNKTISKQVPTAAQAFISDTPNYFSPIGYLSSQIYYLMLPILLSVLTIGLGSSLIAKEEREGTLELLLARPLSRGKLVISKLTAGLVITLLVSAVSLIAAIIMTKAVNLPVGIESLAITTFQCLLMAIAFGSIAFMITTLGRGRSASIGIAALVALGGYVLNSLAATTSALKWPARLMPFHYYHASDMLNSHHPWHDLIVMIGIIIICILISWVSLRRRDID